MNKFARQIPTLLLLALASRLIAMLALPLVETTEPRYAEIARLMATSGDWITPWFEPGVPFWGKPPLSFWTQAAAIKLFGASEFAVRLPGLIIMLLSAWLIYRLVEQLADRLTALLSVVILSTSALGFTMSGAVLTDPFLCFAVTLAWVSIIRSVSSTSPKVWHYGVFVGIAVGLLAKGPVAAVLIIPPVGLWLIFQGRALLGRLPWLGGIALTLLISAPWYIAAEIKTPGFIDYFIVGEHVKRFIDTGWSGDLYGKAHDYPRGTIWIFALWATFPWCFAPLLLIRRRLPRSWHVRRDRLSEPSTLLVLMLLWPLVFFSLAGNILWTYVLPSLPPFAVLLALAISRRERERTSEHYHTWAFSRLPPTTSLIAFSSLVPGLLFVISLGCLVFNFDSGLNSEKALVEYVQSHHTNGPLYYLGKAPFSAQYYSGGNAQSIDWQTLQKLLDDSSQRANYVAIPLDRHNRQTVRLDDYSLPLRENSRYALYKVGDLKVGQLRRSLGNEGDSLPQSITRPNS